ncbi:DUF4262 domain-containing protein [Alteromonas sp. IB21]|nr:DUF4262 domain-containing protein [Alteromonas sp. IB21]
MVIRHGDIVQITDNIEKYGWQFQYVFDADGDRPSFAYTIGLFESYSHPEIMVFGLKKDVMHTLLSNIAADIKNGATFNCDTKFSGLLSDNFETMFKEMRSEWKSEYAGIALDYYDKEIPIWVLFWPDKNNVLPLENDCELTVQEEAISVV